MSDKREPRLTYSKERKCYYFSSAAAMATEYTKIVGIDATKKKIKL